MDLHDIIADELFTNKSFGSLIYLIDKGRELEFTYNGIECFISCSESQSYVSLWCGKEEQCFESVEKLIENSKIGQQKLKDVWMDVEFGTLF